MTGLASILTGGKILHWIFLFLHIYIKATDANICIIVNVVLFWKPLMSATYVGQQMRAWVTTHIMAHMSMIEGS